MADKDNFTPPGAKNKKDREDIPARYNWGTAKKMYKEKRPLEIEEFDKAKDDYLANYGKDTLEKIGLSEEETSEGEPKVEDVDTSAIDEKDSGKSEEDDLDFYMKDLDDYMTKNPKGRDDIPVTTRR